MELSEVRIKHARNYQTCFMSIRGLTAQFPGYTMLLIRQCGLRRVKADYDLIDINGEIVKNMLELVADVIKAVVAKRGMK